MPRTVMPTVVQFLAEVFIHRESIPKAVAVFANNPRLGALTPINIIHRVEASIKSQQIIYSNFKTRLWGLATRCGNAQCDSLPGNIVYRSCHGQRGDGNHDYVTCSCLACCWSSSWIQRPDWLQPMRQRHFFLHDYPLTPAQRDTFTRAMVPPRKKSPTR